MIYLVIYGIGLLGTFGCFFWTRFMTYTGNSVWNDDVSFTGWCPSPAIITLCLALSVFNFFALSILGLYIFVSLVDIFGEWFDHYIESRPEIKSWFFKPLCEK